MNAEQHQVAVDFWTKPVGRAAGSPVGSYSVYVHHRHLLLLVLKADTHFTVPWRVEY